MKKTKFVISAITLIIITGNLFGQTWQNNELFEKAGEIVLRDPLLFQYGVAASMEESLVKVTLIEQVSREAHLCPGVTSSFMIPKIVLQNLYKEYEIPVVGDLVMRTAKEDEFTSRIAEVLHLHSDDEHGKQTWTIDDTIKTGRTTVFYFKRLGTGKEIKLSFNKAAFMQKHVDVVEFVELKDKILHGKSTDAETKKFKAGLKAMVTDLITRGKENYTIEVLN